MAVAGDGVFRIMESCIYCQDTAVERRPYHKYCNCALHKNGGGGGGFTNKCPLSPRGKSVSYPIRRSWSEGNLTLIGRGGGGASGHASPSSTTASPAMGSGLKRTQTQESLNEYF